MNLRHLAIGIIVFALVLGVAGSSAGTSGTVDRGTQIPIADSPGDAFLIVEPLDPDGLSPPNNELVGLFEVTNQFKFAVTITATPVGDPHTESPPKLKQWDQHSQVPETIDPYETETIAGTPVCQGVQEPASKTIEFTITATGTTVPVSITVTESVTITCDGAPGQSGGAGNGSSGNAAGGNGSSENAAGGNGSD